MNEEIPHRPSDQDPSDANAPIAGGFPGGDDGDRGQPPGPAPDDDHGPDGSDT